MTDSFDFDAVVVGAGAIGLASAYALAQRGLSVVVLEKEAAIGQGVSSRNSEVIHGGLYYADRLAEGAAVRHRPAAALRLPRRAQGHLQPLRQAGGGHRGGRDRPPRRHLGAGPHQRRRGHEAADEGRGAGAGAGAALRAGAASRRRAGSSTATATCWRWRARSRSAAGRSVLSTPFEGATPLRRRRLRGPRRRDRADDAGLPPAWSSPPGLSAPGGGGARIEGYPARPDPQAALRQGQLLPAERQGAVLAPDLSAADPRGARHPLPPRPRRPGRASAPTCSSSTQPDYTVDPAAPRAFYNYIRKFWPGLPDGALTPDYVGIRPKIHGPDEPQPDFRIDGAEKHGLDGPGHPVRHREPRPDLVAGDRRGSLPAAALGFRRRVSAACRCR